MSSPQEPTQAPNSASTTASGASDATDPGYVPYVPPVDTAPKTVFPRLTFASPFRWLRLGWQDLRAQPVIGLFYGVCFWVMSLVLRWVFQHSPEYIMSIASGCLLVGPFLAVGLYDVSRRRERASTLEPPTLSRSIASWGPHIRSMGMFVLVLIVLELLWGRASLVVFAVFFNTGMPSTTGVVRAIFNPDNWEFVAVYTLVGGIFASLVYSFAVVSIPMILDRDTDAISAAITSIRVVFANFLVMVFWGWLIAALMVLALVPWGLGLIVLGPLLGHASWHAYREAVQWMEVETEVHP